MNTAGEKTNDESEITADVEEPAESQELIAVPEPTENMPDDILAKDKEEQRKQKAAASTLEDLSKEWDEEEIEPQAETETAAAEAVNAAQEAVDAAQEATEAAASDQQAAVEPEPEKETSQSNEEQETIENIENFLESSETASKTMEV